MQAVEALARFDRHVWLIDFEFHQPPGHRPDPICMVAKCALTGEVRKAVARWPGNAQESLRGRNPRVSLRLRFG